MEHTGARYEILNTLGRGGFGTVYRALYRGEGGFHKQVAVKILNPEYSEDEEIASRLRDEARMLGLIRHRAIVQVDGLVQLQQRWLVVMEYIEGASLQALLASGPMPPGPALEIIGEVAGALHAAWTSQGTDGRPLKLMHRDIKPSNIQLTSMGEVKVLDFGIARAEMESREAETSAYALGTADYMSPERLDFFDSPAGDVYALGVVLFEMLTGEHFGRTSANEARHSEKFFDARARLWAATGDNDLTQLVSEMLVFNPDARPSARDVERRAAALRRQRQGGFLRDWAERAVPAVISARAPESGDLSGAVLETGLLSPQTLAAPIASPRRGPLLLGLSAALLVMIFALLGVILQRGSAPAPTPSGEEALMALAEQFAADEPAVEASPAPAEDSKRPGVTTSPRADPRSAPPERPAPVEPEAPALDEVEIWNTPPSGASAETPGPRWDSPAEVSAEPASAPPTRSAAAGSSASTSAGRASGDNFSAPPGRTWVALQGEITSVYLSSGSERYPLPSLVPAGDWLIEANFPGRGSVGAGTLTLSGQSKLTLSCDEVSSRCSER